MENFVSLLEYPLRECADMPALSNFKGKELSYGEVGVKIKQLHSFFKTAGIKPQDKVALVGKNSANWAMSYVATVSYGAVVVPILPDFPVEDIQNIINHSDSIFLFADLAIFESINYDELPEVKGVIGLQSFNVIDYKSDKQSNLQTHLESAYKEQIDASGLVFPQIDNDKLAAISYTSGTTGFSKGVMLSHRSLYENVIYAQRNMPLEKGDQIVSFLPIAHSYGCAFEFLFPFSLGCHITFLTKTPSPQVVTEAFGKIKPRLVLSVPLILEKIYKKRILPVVEKPSVKVLLKVPLLNAFIYKKIRRSLTDAFGGNFHEVVIGGAALSADVENLLRRIKFPFTVGYGMTECGPLISYDGWRTTRAGSAGKLVDSLEIKVDSPDPENVAGEIMVRGANVMDGYYKNKEATDQVITNDHWLKTGDLGVVDRENYIYIKGRSKSMILGPSGKNIYPEEIEDKLNNIQYVQESLVIEVDQKIVALVYPDEEVLKADQISQTELQDIMEGVKKQANEQLPKYMNIHKIVTWDQEFEKTPKRSIKRFKYQNINL